VRIYLVQHGEALQKEADPRRGLTDKGKNDSARTAEFMKRSGCNVDIIWHSAKLRAKETAQIFAGRLSPAEGVLEKEGLTPNDPVSGAAEAAASIGKDIMLVGHLPFLQKFASILLSGGDDKEVARFNMGGVICLEKAAGGKWQITCEVVPDEL